MKRALIVSALLFFPVPGFGDYLRGGITATPDDLRPRYLREGAPPLNTDPAGRETFTKSFLLDIAYNLKLWHFAQDRGGLGRTVTCNGIEHLVSKIIVEGVHLHDNGSRAIVYYSADFIQPQPAPGSPPACPGGGLMLPIQRMTDGEWYAPDWGYRLNRGR